MLNQYVSNITRMSDQTKIILLVAAFTLIFTAIIIHECFKYYLPALRNKSDGKVIPIDKIKRRVYGKY